MRELGINRLAAASSPYLLEHANDPVDWWPWVPAAWAEAQRLDRPILLSSGYRTCHWCHVMQHQSFANEAVAAALNETFVCVKLDREERPDVDEQYMWAAQLASGQGGWPLTALLLPDRRPFYATTYVPPLVLVQLSERVRQLWTQQRPDLEEQAAAMVQGISEMLARQSAHRPAHAPSAGGTAALIGDLDPEHGGTVGAPKFPHDMLDTLLLQRFTVTGEQTALEAALVTLDHMAAGGLWDHVGGGFYRYSTDAEWTVPHYEKMLYNQAGLLRAYARAAAATGHATYRHVCQRLVEFVRRELTDPVNGAFFTALDADSEGQEGRYYLWSSAQIAEVLGASAQALARCLVLAESDASWSVVDGSERQGVLRRPMADSRKPWPSADGGLADALHRLLAARSQRERPATDDKVVTSWNGLMISALAEAGRLLSQPGWIELATRSARYVLQAHRPGGVLHRISRLGRASQPGLLEDYAALGSGCLELWRSTGETSWLDAADMHAGDLARRFETSSGGLLYGSPVGTSDLLWRETPTLDTVMPSANALAAELLLGLEAAGRSNHAGLSAALAEGLAASAAGRPAYSAHGLRITEAVADGPTSANRLSVVVEPRPADEHVTIRIVATPGWHLGSTVADSAAATIKLTPSGGTALVLEATLCQPGVWEAQLPRGAQVGAASVLVQACDAQRCLLPARRWVWLPGAS